MTFSEGKRCVLVMEFSSGPYTTSNECTTFKQKASWQYRGRESRGGGGGGGGGAHHLPSLSATAIRWQLPRSHSGPPPLAKMNGHMRS
ncbi:hypothetical protein QIS74_10446 [Colletotrichum tabaci]|uniref:Uncharacterized protein n=1 Tax=Colletotrichum tabaci TaxID=1209068 RepID=A0AAV9T0G8_9PEZI